MGSPPRTLLSLPEDVLVEILSLLLLDAAWSSTRAAILRTCSTLHQLGVPLLYRVVDLAVIYEPELYSAWDGLFGPGGLLTEDGRILGLSRTVRELRIRYGPDEYQDFDFGTIILPNCTTVTVNSPDLWLALGHWPRLRSFLSNLPVRDLSLRYGRSTPPPSPAGSFSWATGSQTLSGPTNVQPWPDLQTLRFGETLWCDFGSSIDFLAGPTLTWIAFSEWTFQTLVVDVATIFDEDVVRWTWFFQAFFGPHDAQEMDNWWPGLKRIEMRLHESAQTELRRRLDEARQAGPLARLQRRIFPMVVFVDQDGSERKFFEDET